VVFSSVVSSAVLSQFFLYALVAAQFF
jgi:hypothetical protein